MLRSSEPQPILNPLLPDVGLGRGGYLVPNKAWLAIFETSTHIFELTNQLRHHWVEETEKQNADFSRREEEEDSVVFDEDGIPTTIHQVADAEVDDIKALHSTKQCRST